MRPLHGKIDATTVGATRRFARYCNALYLSSGARGLSDYLQSCKLAVKLALGDVRKGHTYSPRVSLTRGGLPRIIAPIHRKVIRSNTEASYHYIRL